MKEQRLEQALGHSFVRRGLLQQALTHRSAGSPHNERLEFLGDSLLNCVVAAALFEHFPNHREGELSRLRANLVCQESLARIAQAASLGDCLRLGEGEMKSAGFRRPSILADALEALFGAIYLDAGFTAVQAVIDKLYRELIDGIDPAEIGKDPKTALQEYLQSKRIELPQYRLVETRGEAHDQSFEIECAVGALGIRCRGVGSSRRAAEQDAARLTMNEIATK
jgi:ribonuclease-3